MNKATTLNSPGSDSDGTIVKYERDLEGDGIYDWNGTGTGVVQHPYAKLRVTDDEGASDTEVCEVTVITKSEDGDDSPGFGVLVALISFGMVAVMRKTHLQAE